MVRASRVAGDSRRAPVTDTEQAAAAITQRLVRSGCLEKAAAKVDLDQGGKSQPPELAAVRFIRQ